MMSNLYWLSEAQMERLRPYFPKARGRARVYGRRVLSGIIFINRNGLRWCDAPAEYGPPMTLYNRWKRRNDMGVFARLLMGLAEQAPNNKTISIDATYLKAQRTASSLRLKKGTWAPDQTDLRLDEHQTACDYNTSGRPVRLFITTGQVVIPPKNGCVKN
jgi:transposase